MKRKSRLMINPCTAAGCEMELQCSMVRRIIENDTKFIPYFYDIVFVTEERNLKLINYWTLQESKFTRTKQ